MFTGACEAGEISMRTEGLQNMIDVSLLSLNQKYITLLKATGLFIMGILESRFLKVH